jgi:tetratricopeptide (TPR) repeat protein
MTVVKSTDAAVTPDSSERTDADLMVEFREAVELLKNEYPAKALVKLRRAFETDKRNPYYMSFLGLCLARAEREWDQASQLCEAAVQLKRKEIKFHLNLIEVYALAGHRDQALDSVDAALKLFRNDSRLKKLYGKLTKRRASLLPFLNRNHFLNRELGKLRHRILNKLRDRS